MMPPMNPTALAIAAGFALLAFVPLAWRRLGRPWVYVCVVAGALVSPIAREGVQMVWAEVGRYPEATRNPAAAVVYLLLVALAGELVKAVVPVAGVLFRADTDKQTATAYGAAAGAGFGFMSAQPVLTMALGLVGSAYITPLSSTAAIVGWFFPILAHVATTAMVTRAAVQGRFGATFFAMWMVQFGLGLAQRLPVVSGISTGLAVTAVVSIVLLLIARRVGLRPSLPTPAEA
jgi:hypothetical protein